MIFPKKILNLSLIIMSIGIFIFFLFFRKNSESSLNDLPQNSSSELHEELSPILVRVVPARRGELVIKLKSLGETVTDRRIVLKAEVSGIIRTLRVKEGQQVKKGELLIELDDREYRLELRRIEALRLKYLSELFLEKKFAAPEKGLSPSEVQKINQAQKDYKKATYLHSKNIISKEEFDKAKMNYEFVLIETGRKKEEIRAASLTQAEVDLEIARMKLERTRIKAPFAGVISNIRVCPQEFVGVGSELFMLVDIHKIKVEARVLESEIGKMKVGQKVDLRFSSYPSQVFKGNVKTISPIVNPGDKTCKVIIDLHNPKEEIKPGMHAEVKIAAEIYRDRLLIPQEAVLVRAGRTLVFVVKEGFAKWRYIEVGLENEDYAEVLNGIREDEIVITDGHFTLAHDTRVEVVK